MQAGAVTRLGEDVREGREAPAGGCGMVYCPAKEFYPPAKKMAGIVLPAGGLKIRATAAPQLANPRNQKWISLKIEDLPALAIGAAKTKPELRAIGPIISGCYPQVHAATNFVLACVCMCRLFRPLPPPQTGIWIWALQFKTCLTPNHRTPPARMSDEDYLAGVESRRRKAIGRAQEIVRITGWTSKMKKFKAFRKLEKGPGFSKHSMLMDPLDKDLARGIYGPNDVVHAKLAPWLKPMLPWLKQMWSPDALFFYAATTPEKLHVWLTRLASFGDGLIFWGDMSQCESAFDQSVQDFVESFYTHIFAGEVDARRIFDAISAPSGTMGDLKFQTRKMNGSGRPDTSLMTTIAVGFAVTLSVTAAWNRIPLRSVEVAHLEEFKQLGILGGAGDDTLGIIPSRGRTLDIDFINRSRENITQFGFSIKMFASYKLSDAVFLAHRPLPVNGKWYWHKTHGRMVYKLGWQVGLDGDARARMNGIMLMVNLTGAHTPIIADIAQAWLGTQKGAKVNMVVEDENKPWELMGRVNPGGYADDTIVALADAYSHTKDHALRGDLDTEDVIVTPADVRHCIKHVWDVIGKSGGIPCVLDHWLLRHMVYEDEL